MPVELDAGFGQRQLPVNGGLSGVALGHASGQVGGEFLASRDALVQVLAGDGRELKFDHIEPGGIFGRVVHLKAGGQRAGGGRGQMLKDGISMHVEVILHEHDFFSLWVVSG